MLRGQRIANLYLLIIDKCLKLVFLVRNKGNIIYTFVMRFLIILINNLMLVTHNPNTLNSKRFQWLTGLILSAKRSFFRLNLYIIINSTLNTINQGFKGRIWHRKCNNLLITYTNKFLAGWVSCRLFCLTIKPLI